MNVFRQFLKNRLGTLCQRTLDTTDLTVGLDGQKTFVRAPLIQLLERELKQRQYFRMFGRCIAQHVVQTFTGGGVFFEPQSGSTCRQTDYLTDLGRRRRQQIVLSIAFFQRNQFGVVRQTRIEITAQGRNHPDTTTACHRIQHVDKGDAILSDDALLREHLLHLVDEQYEFGVAATALSYLLGKLFRTLLNQCVLD